MMSYCDHSPSVSSVLTFERPSKLLSASVSARRSAHHIDIFHLDSPEVCCLHLSYIVVPWVLNFPPCRGPGGSIPTGNVASLVSSNCPLCRPRGLSWMRRPTGDQEVASSTPAEVGNILSWRLIMKCFLRSFSPFR